jgi:plasmid stabilization system protein ParE
MKPASRIEVSEDARQDLALQHAWYSIEVGADIAERYLAAFRSTAELLAHQPSIGLLRRFRSPRLRDIRSFQMASPFRVHLIFYRVEGDCLVVFRVMHGMRDLPRRLIGPSSAN